LIFSTNSLAIRIPVHALKILTDLDKEGS